jgi:hypothetical protein
MSLSSLVEGHRWTEKHPQYVGTSLSIPEREQVAVQGSLPAPLGSPGTAAQDLSK